MVETDEQKRNRLGLQLGELYAAGKFDEAAKLQAEVSTLHKRIVDNEAVIAVKLAFGKFIPRQLNSDIAVVMREHKVSAFSIRYEFPAGWSENNSIQPIASIQVGSAPRTTSANGSSGTSKASRTVEVYQGEALIYTGTLKAAEIERGTLGTANAANAGLANRQTAATYVKQETGKGYTVKVIPDFDDAVSTR